MAQSKQFDLGLAELGSRDAIKASIAEFIAVTIFVFVGVGSIASFLLTANQDVPLILASGIVLIALAHGLTIALLVAGIGPMSGGHVNPAVTFAMMLTNRISLTRGVMYWIAQMLGAVFGALLLKLFLDDALLKSIPGAGGHQISHDIVTNLGALGVEATLTFVLVWTVFATAVDPKGNHLIAPLAIGFAVLVIHLVAIPITGAGVNPARTFGPMLVFNRFNDGWWVYYVGPMLGASIAGLLYYFLYLMDDEKAAAQSAPAQ